MDLVGNNCESTENIESNDDNNTLSIQNIIEIEDLVDSYVKYYHGDSTEITNLVLEDLDVSYELHIPSILKGNISTSNIPSGSKTYSNPQNEQKIVNTPFQSTRNKKFTITPVKTLTIPNASVITQTQLTSFPDINETFIVNVQQDFQSDDPQTVTDDQYIENEGIPIVVAPNSNAQISFYKKRITFDTIVTSSITLDGFIGFEYSNNEDGSHGCDTVSIQELVSTLNLNASPLLNTSNEDDTVVYQGESRLEGIVDVALYLQVKGNTYNNKGKDYEFTQIISEDFEASLSPNPSLSEGDYYINFKPGPKPTPEENTVITFTKDFLTSTNKGNLHAAQNALSNTGAMSSKFNYGSEATSLKTIDTANQSREILRSSKNIFNNHGDSEASYKSLSEEITKTNTLTTTSEATNFIEAGMGIEVSVKFGAPPGTPVIAEMSTKTSYAFKYSHTWKNTDTNTKTSTEKLTIPSQEVKVPAHSSVQLSYILESGQLSGSLSTVKDIQNNISLSIPYVAIGYYNKNIEVTSYDGFILHGGSIISSKTGKGNIFELVGNGLKKLQSEEILNAKPNQFFNELFQLIMPYPLIQTDSQYRRLGVLVGLGRKVVPDSSFKDFYEYYLLLDAETLLNTIRFDKLKATAYVATKDIPFTASIGTNSFTVDTGKPKPLFD
ncbi:ETX/MTX2 family pore-forming toxin [Bacillus cereus]|nr:ETX/MTX2 family pore-forming toxin [Bacillus cereus]